MAKHLLEYGLFFLLPLVLAVYGPKVLEDWIASVRWRKWITYTCALLIVLCGAYYQRLRYQDEQESKQAAKRTNDDMATLKAQNDSLSNHVLSLLAQQQAAVDVAVYPVGTWITTTTKDGSGPATAIVVCRIQNRGSPTALWDWSLVAITPNGIRATGRLIELTDEDTRLVGRGGETRHFYRDESLSYLVGAKPMQKGEIARGQVAFVFDRPGEQIDKDILAVSDLELHFQDTEGIKHVVPMCVGGIDMYDKGETWSGMKSFAK